MLAPNRLLDLWKSQILSNQYRLDKNAHMCRGKSKELRVCGHEGIQVSSELCSFSISKSPTLFASCASSTRQPEHAAGCPRPTHTICLNSLLLPIAFSRLVTVFCFTLSLSLSFLHSILFPSAFPVRLASCRGSSCSEAAASDAKATQDSRDSLT